jgi:hypothetical protein
MSSALNTRISGWRFLSVVFVLFMAGSFVPTMPANASPAKPLTLPGVSTIQKAIEKSTSPQALSAKLVPLLSGEAKSMFWGGSCQIGGPGFSSVAHACPLGDLAATETVVLYGDSFSMEWAPALNTLGIQDHFKVLLFSRNGCPWADIKIVDFEGSVDTGCLPFRSSVLAAISALDPAPSLVVLSEETQNSVPVVSWNNAIKKTIVQLQKTGSPVDVIFGESDATSPPSACLARNVSDVSKCNTDVKAGLGYQEYEQLAAAVTSVHAGLVNTSSLFCFRGECPDVIGGTLVHSDSWHIDQKFAELTARGLSSLIGCTINQLSSLSARSRVVLQSLLSGASSAPTRLACAAAVMANGI